jgi:hypothetical protein
MLFRMLLRMLYQMKKIKHMAMIHTTSTCWHHSVTAQRAESRQAREQGAENREQRAESREQRADRQESKVQRAESREQTGKEAERQESITTAVAVCGTMTIGMAASGLRAAYKQRDVQQCCPGAM